MRTAKTIMLLLLLSWWFLGGVPLGIASPDLSLIGTLEQGLGTMTVSDVQTLLPGTRTELLFLGDLRISGAISQGYFNFVIVDFSEDHIEAIILDRSAEAGVAIDETIQINNIRELLLTCFQRFGSDIQYAKKEVFQHPGVWEPVLQWRKGGSYRRVSLPYNMSRVISIFWTDVPECDPFYASETEGCSFLSLETFNTEFPALEICTIPGITCPPSSARQNALSPAPSTSPAPSKPSPPAK